MVRTAWAVATVLASASALAAPGDLIPRGNDESEPLVVLDGPPEGAKCLKAGALCFAAGARTTIAVASQVAAAQPDGKPAAMPVTPRFARAASLATREGASSATEGASHAADSAWTLDVVSTLKRPSLAGNALFMLFDLDDPEALPNRQFTALYQQSLKSAKTVAAHLTLTPDEGFRPGHSYRLRIVQLVGGKELLLAEGDVTLL